MTKTLRKTKHSEGKLQKCATVNTILTYAMGVRVEEGQRQKKGLSHKNSYGRITIYLLQRDNLSYLLFLLIEKEYGQECKKEWSKGIVHESIFEFSLTFSNHEYVVH